MSRCVWSRSDPESLRWAAALLRVRVTGRVDLVVRDNPKRRGEKRNNRERERERV